MLGFLGHLHERTISAWVKGALLEVNREKAMGRIHSIHDRDRPAFSLELTTSVFCTIPGVCRCFSIAHLFFDGVSLEALGPGVSNHFRL